MHGAWCKTAQAAWAARNSRFTLLFERFAIELLQHCANIKAAANLFRLSWHAVNKLMRRAVTRRLSRRQADAMAYFWALTKKASRQASSM
jgi:transposase